MNALRPLLDSRNDGALTILRLMLGAVFFAHGAQLMLGWFGGHGYSASMDAFTQKMDIPAFFAFLAIITQFFGAIALILGLFSRVAAAGLFCVMVVAIAKVHWSVGFFMNWYGLKKGEGYEYHLLVLAICLALLLRGSGALSVDRWLSRPKRESGPKASVSAPGKADAPLGKAP